MMTTARDSMMTIFVLHNLEELITSRRLPLIDEAALQRVGLDRGHLRSDRLAAAMALLTGAAYGTVRAVNHGSAVGGRCATHELAGACRACRADWPVEPLTGQCRAAGGGRVDGPTPGKGLGRPVESRDGGVRSPRRDFFRSVHRAQFAGRETRAPVNGAPGSVF